MFDNNLTLGKKTNNPPTTEKWTCSFPEKRPIFMIDWLKSVAHWRQNPQMRSNDWFLLFCGWSHYTITKRSYERRSRKGGNELATISQCMKKRPNFIGYLIKLQKWSLFLRTARNAPRFYYTGYNSKIFSCRLWEMWFELKEITTLIEVGVSPLFSGSKKRHNLNVTKS